LAVINDSFNNKVHLTDNKNDDYSQHWGITKIGDNGFRFNNRNVPGKSLDVTQDALNFGAYQLQLWPTGTFSTQIF